MARATKKSRSRLNRKTRNYKAKRINRRGGGPLPPPTKIPQTPDMTVEVGAFDMTVPKSSLEIGFVYNNMGQGSDPGWEGWNPAWTKRKGGGQAVVPAPAPAPGPVEKLPQSINMTVEVGAFDLTVYKTSLKPGTPYWGMGVGSDPGWVGWPPEWYNGQQGGSRLPLPPLPQSPDMTVEVGSFNYTVPKATLKPGTPYHTIGMELGSHVDPGWAGWNPEWSHPLHRAAVQAATNAGNAARAEGANHNTAAARAIAAFTAQQQQEANSSNNNSNSSSYMGEFASEEAPAEEAAVEVSAENNNNSTAEEERAENAGVNSFLSGGSRRRNKRKSNRKNSRR